jgi:predicted nuclease with TOPRIM domain
MSGKALIESIAKGAEKLIGENRRLRAEVEKLEAAREKLREENRKLTAENRMLERKVTVRDLAAGFSGESALNDRHGAKIARARVNRLLREVDRCMVLLSKE